jgi:EAL domain-containing protein (putative c-di-GMP-specific phosphodiesterase class I)
MVYQPILSKNGKEKNYKIVGMEALIRWHNPQLGTVPPSIFIPIAEESKLIQEFNQWIINRSIEDFREIQPYHKNGFYLSINVSPRGLHSENFSRNLQNAVLRNQLNPKSLQVEITETSLLENGTATEHNLKALVGMGIQLAIDDFGTGYASLNYLQKIPAKTIKIDRSFINNVNLDPKKQELVKAILLMGKSLNKNLIAEGVETVEHLSFLEDNACTQFQGYLFSRPLTLNDMIHLISEHNMELTLP